MARKVYAVANQKGGVGKTTTVVNAATAMALGGRRVAVIDLDPQANATSHFGLAKDLPLNTYRVLTGEIRIVESCTPTSIDGLWVVPSHADLYGAALELPRLEDWPHMLRKALQGFSLAYDYIWIDTPPSLGVLTINAMTAADSLVVPVQCEYFALEGLTTLIRAMERVRRTTNPGLGLEALVLTMYDERTNLSRQVKMELARHFGDEVLQYVIPRNVRLAEAPSFGEPIFTYDVRSRGALAYLGFTKELLYNGAKGAGQRT